MVNGYYNMPTKNLDDLLSYQIGVLVKWLKCIYQSCILIN